MKRIWPLAALGVVAFIVFAVASLPADVVVSRLAPYGVQADGVSGTVWRGAAQVLQVRGANLGRVTWSLHPLPLFIGRLSADVRMTRADGSVQTKLSASSGRIAFADLTASVPLTALPPNTIPGGWVGSLGLSLDKLELAGGWPTVAVGTIQVLDVTGPANRPINMGRYKVTFPADTPSGANAVVGALSDLGGPLQVNGTVQLKSDRTFLAEGLVAARPEAPREITNMVQILGSPDDQGRRPFAIENKM
jgi:general secretion pathway protein N